MRNIIVHFMDGKTQILRWMGFHFHGPSNTLTLKDGPRLTIIRNVRTVQVP